MAVKRAKRTEIDDAPRPTAAPVDAELVGLGEDVVPPELPDLVLLPEGAGVVEPDAEPEMKMVRCA